MSNGRDFLGRYWGRPEAPVVEKQGHRCDKCSTIQFSSFRARTFLDETFRPVTLVMGSFETVQKSAFAGCWTCRLVLCTLLNTLTTLRDEARLYQIAKVGLRLNLDDDLTVHCWASDGSKVPLLGRDALLIPLRDSDNVEDENHERDYEWVELNIDPLKMRMLKPSDNNEYIPNPPIDEPDLVRSWLWTCSACHDTCPDTPLYSEDGPILPTRVLDLVHPDGPRVIDTNGKKGEYVTLSHCWGQSQHNYKLNKDNMTSMMTHIDLNDLPKTFSQAALITQSMRIRYIWIDSMCIIQPTAGDTEDWTREGPRMADYYRNAAFTIAASVGTDSNFGCFFARPGRQLKAQPWPLFKDPIQRKWDEFSVATGRNPEWLPVMQPSPASWLWQVQNCPLNSRAWVLQERLMSKRILHCTMQGLMWECAELHASEQEPLGCQFDYRVRDEGLLQLHNALGQGASFVTDRYWRQVVERFSGLGITYNTDRLPALAGLAKAIQEETKDVYIAGHWKESLLPSLLWFRLHTPTSDPVRLADAPSWAWSSTSSHIKFTSLDESDFPARAAESYNITAKLANVSVQPKTLNPFAWVCGSSLRLRGRLMKYSPEICPTLQSAAKSAEECWHGYRPIQSAVQQRVITIPSMDENWDPVPDDAAEQMANMVADDNLLQSNMKEEVARAMESPSTGEIRQGEERDQDTLVCIFDIPDEDKHEELYLFEVLREVGEHKRLEISEGLALVASDGGTYKRVGFFTLKTKSSLFSELEEMEVELA
ncbi:HET domain-containing protein [Fusarium keratoplasticum]|nr:HET domain-containing protein [Fusarium keratoplasticum]